jgi:hypothetical protein
MGTFINERRRGQWKKQHQQQQRFRKKVHSINVKDQGLGLG